jgi:demethylmenaquinone methyltransferase / 2-methoxy-6-polyprenyl-1,4-benzoquinol methylase
MTVANARDSARAPLVPHPRLTSYYDDAADRLSFVKRLFDDTAADYDGITQFFSFGTGRHYRARMLRRAGLRSGTRVLDVATGTGMIAAAARDVLGPSGRVTALDLSTGMLNVARAHGGIEFVQGTADALPFGDGQFDLVTMGYGLRHVADLGVTFWEFARVLRPGGRILVLEIVRPAIPLLHVLAQAYLGRIVPALSRFAPSGRNARTLMRYYSDTIEHCVPPSAILSAMRANGLADAEFRTEWGLFAIYSAKRGIEVR